MNFPFGQYSFNDKIVWNRLTRGNDIRLTGISDRGTCIRIPLRNQRVEA